MAPYPRLPLRSDVLWGVVASYQWRIRTRRLFLTLALVAAACSGGDGATDTSVDAGATTTTAATAATTTVAPSTTAPAQPGARGGTLSINGEDVALQSRCFLEDQAAAGGGGTIELSGQGQGTTADGTPIVIDITRFGADSQFAGDDVSITMGDPFSDDVINLEGRAEIGTISLDGSVLSATDYTVRGDDGEQLISFSIEC